MKKKEKKPVDGNAWMATYSDMVTLLMAFFVVLLAMSSTDENKFNAFVESFTNMPYVVVDDLVGNTDEMIESEAESTSDMDEVYELLRDHIVANNMESSITISKFNDVVYIRFNSSLFFLPDKYTLRSESIPVLDFIGDSLVGYEHAINVVNVLGFTATVDTGTYWMLSGERAAVVATHINYESGFPTDKLVVLGYGNRYPVATNDTSEGREQNRRVELIIVGNEEAEDFNVNHMLDQYHNGELVDTSSIGNVNVSNDVSALTPGVEATPSVDISSDVIG